MHATGGIRTHDLSRRTATDLRLRPHGYWDRHKIRLGHENLVFNAPPVREIQHFTNKSLIFIPFSHEPEHNCFLEYT